MSSTSDPLFIDYCDRKAAQYAALKWHYSRTMPSGKLVSFGVWEHGEFKGAVMFGLGASPNTYKQFGLIQGEGCELTRVALRSHDAPVTRIVSICIKFLRRDFPGLKLIVSFADTYEGHHGGIYQAGNWIYCGLTQPKIAYIVNGRKLETRTVSTWWPKGTRPPGPEGMLEMIRKHKDPRAKLLRVPGKHRYVYLLGHYPALKETVMKMREPYPKRAPEALTDDAPAIQADEGGSNPTSAHSTTGVKA